MAALRNFALLFLVYCAFTITQTLADISNEVSVRLTNNLYETISIMWRDGKRKVKLFDLEENESITMNTFVGHKFVAIERESKNPVFDFIIHPDTYAVDFSHDSYDIGSNYLEESCNTSGSCRSEVEGELPKKPVEVAKVTARPPGYIHSRVQLLNTKSTSVGVKFKSLYPKPLDMWYDDGRSGVMQGSIRPGRETTINAYDGHVFFFTEAGEKEKEIARFSVSMNQSLYLIRSASHTDDELRSLLPSGAFNQIQKELQFMEDYKAKTGIEWRHYYGPNGPRPAPILYMHAADYIGQIHDLTSKEGFWHCDGSADKCQSKDIVSIPLEVVSIQPRAFLLDRLISDFEADHIVEVAKSRVKSSTVGDSEGGGVRSSDTRTSRNTWISRSTDPIIESVYLRVADLLKIDEHLLNSNTNAEEMQVVHYQPGQKYDAHHDWGVSGYPESRFLTLLLYLNEPVSGGETSFPKGADGLGFKIMPKKASSALFYDLLPDGNGDELSLHAALPVRQGEKWLANFWVWDPKRR